jgi:hypothetical protein
MKLDSRTVEEFAIQRLAMMLQFVAEEEAVVRSLR